MRKIVICVLALIVFATRYRLSCTISAGLLRHIIISGTRSRVDVTFRGLDVEIDGSDELKEWIVFRCCITFFLPVIPPNEFRHENLDFQKSEIEADAHSLAGCKAVNK